MRLLQRYVLWELLRVFTLLLVAVTAIVLLTGVLKEAVRHGLGLVDLVRVAPFVVLNLLPWTLPVTLLLTVSLVFGRLSGDREIVAVRAAGIRITTLLFPAFGLAFALALATFALKNHAIPFGTRQLRSILVRGVEQMVLNRLHTDGQISEPGLGYSVAAIRVDGRRLIEPIFRVVDETGQQTTLTAAEATLRIRPEAGRVELLLRDGRVRLADGGTYEFDENTLNLPVEMPEGVWKAKYASIADIRREIHRLETEASDRASRAAMNMAAAFLLADFGALNDQELRRMPAVTDYYASQVNRCRMELHNRFSLSAGCFLFALVGAPWSVLRGNRNFLSTFLVVCSPVALVYYPVTVLMINLADRGYVAAWWSAWVSGVLMLIAGAVLIRRVLRDQRH